MREMTFEQWMAGVDKQVQRRIGVSVYDLPDWNYRDAYDAGAGVVDTAKDVIAVGI